MAAAGLAAARDRHPSVVPRLGVLALAERIGQQLADEGHPFPGFAAALLALRGGRGLDQVEFAAVLGVPASLLRALERGVLAPSEAPPRLANLVTDFRRQAGAEEVARDVAVGFCCEEITWSDTLCRTRRLATTRSSAPS